MAGNQIVSYLTPGHSYLSLITKSHVKTESNLHCNYGCNTIAYMGKIALNEVYLTCTFRKVHNLMPLDHETKQYSSHGSRCKKNNHHAEAPYCCSNNSSLLFTSFSYHLLPYQITPEPLALLWNQIND